MLTENNIHEHESMQLNELFGALAKAQLEMTNALKNADNPFHKSNYADLASCMAAARPHLAKHNLCVLQQIVYEGEVSYLITRLGHASGQWIESKERIRPKDNTIQAYGSTVTYLRRYNYCSLVGVAPSGDDDDGEKAMERKHLPPPPKARSVDAYITADEVAEIETMIDGDMELMKDVLKKGNISKLEYLEKNRFSGLMTFLEKKIEEGLSA